MRFVSPVSSTTLVSRQNNAGSNDRLHLLGQSDAERVHNERGTPEDLGREWDLVRRVNLKVPLPDFIDNLFCDSKHGYFSKQINVFTYIRARLFQSHFKCCRAHGRIREATCCVWAGRGWARKASVTEVLEFSSLMTNGPSLNACIVCESLNSPCTGVSSYKIGMGDANASQPHRIYREISFAAETQVRYLLESMPHDFRGSH
ncbi:hypothetical protein LXA43DRAFT_518713 [Ganoderma leucocontextum]|nr:hypothetical protein LXA43DRAFT_518713 [Ganoderma leucocontextum]